VRSRRATDERAVAGRNSQHTFSVLSIELEGMGIARAGIPRRKPASRRNHNRGAGELCGDRPDVRDRLRRPVDPVLTVGQPVAI